MLRALTSAQIPWPALDMVQVDERVASAGHPDRNLTHLQESLLDHAPRRVMKSDAHAQNTRPRAFPMLVIPTMPAAMTAVTPKDS
jgi:6-phosphogluconolactonase/glucosamine-6-phosphate isomerase/deaminase